MFEEGQLYSPVTEDEHGAVTVHLAPSHPGVDDPAYLARRAQIAASALGLEDPPTPAPEIAYTAAEHEVWRTVCRELTVKHRALRLRLPARLGRRRAADRPRPATHRGLRAGCGPDRLHLRPRRRASSRWSSSTARSPSASSTPPSTCATRPSRCTRPSPISSTRSSATASRSPPALRRVAPADRRGRPPARDPRGARLPRQGLLVHVRVRRHRENGELRCYGAGLLSSYGEIDEFRNADVRPLDFPRDGHRIDYDITHYQPILYRAESLDHLIGRGRRLLRDGRRRHPGAPRPHAAAPAAA